MAVDVLGAAAVVVRTAGAGATCVVAESEDEPDGADVVADAVVADVEAVAAVAAALEDGGALVVVAAVQEYEWLADPVVGSADGGFAASVSDPALLIPATSSAQPATAATDAHVAATLRNPM